MRVLVLASAALALLGTPQGRTPLRLKCGDTVTVTSDYGGDFKIMPDGAIYGRGFGRLMLEGKTWAEAQAEMRKALHKFVRDDEVNVVLKDLRRDVVFVAGISGGKGSAELLPDMTLRQLLASASLDDNADQVQIQLYRDGKKLSETNAADILSSDQSGNTRLQANDVVTITPIAFVRVWVTGVVQRPGQIRVPAGTDVYRAIAESGGVRTADPENDRTLEDEAKVYVRRGPDTFELPLRQDMKKQPLALESGDTVSIAVTPTRRITVGGEITKPGEILMRGDHSLVGAIAMAGGVNQIGTLTNVLVLRKGELYSIDASKTTTGQAATAFDLESGDMIYVQRNEKTFLVLGDVGRPGKIAMRDGRTYRLTDALAESEGLGAKGTLRRVALARADSTGKIKVTQYNLDEFLKDGKVAANPEIQPGDCILFGQPKGVTFAGAMQALPAALLFESIMRNR